MKIASIKKTSLLDYPGKVSAIIGTQGCNMRCPWCHNAYLIPYEFAKNATKIDQTDFFSFLEQRKGLLDGVVLTGGEPTLQRDLPEFCERVKAMGFSVKLDTNGTTPKMLDRLIQNDLVDYLAMDMKTDLDQYPKLLREPIDKDAIVESVNLVLSSKKPYEFRTTCVAPFICQQNIAEIGRLLQGAARHFLQKCKDPHPEIRHHEYEITNDTDMIPLQMVLEKYVSVCEVR
jgi:pyruvate formate lyase activating enzyme